MPTDKSLLHRLKQGDATAFEWLVGQFEGPLFRFFVCDHRNYHLAQEQTSETFTQLVRSIRTMNGNEDQLRAYVFSVARHVKSRHWRRQSLSHTSLEGAKAICDPRPPPETVVDDREQTERVLFAISEFEPAVRDILLFRFVEELSINEVATIVELPVGTVKSHIHRGIAKLKQILTDSECQS